VDTLVSQRRTGSATRLPLQFSFRACLMPSIIHSVSVKPDSGQISAGQPVGGAGGFRQVIEAARQVMGRAGERQVAKRDLSMVNG
jgi:acetyl-CoA acetyltransferase